MKFWLVLGAIALLFSAGSWSVADMPGVHEAAPLPKLRPGYPEKIGVAGVWSLVDAQPFGFPGCTQRLQFEGKALTGSRVYYPKIETKWIKSKERVTVTYAHFGYAGVITEVKIGDQNYYRNDRAQAFFTWDDRLPWEK